MPATSVEESFDYEAVASFPVGDALTNRLKLEFFESYYIEDGKTGEELWAVGMRRNTQFSVKQYQLIKACESAGHKIIVVTPEEGIIDDRSGLEVDAKRTPCVQLEMPSAPRLTLSCRRAPPLAVPLDSLDRLIDYGAVLARRNFDASGAVRPVRLQVLRNGDLEFVEIAGDVYDKDCLAESLREIFKIRGVERYLLIDETWSSSLPPDGKYGSSISSHPDRKEDVWIYAEDKGDWRSATLRILRPNGRQPKLAKLRKLSRRKHRVRGRFTGLLRPLDASDDSMLIRVTLTPIPEHLAFRKEPQADA